MFKIINMHQFWTCLAILYPFFFMLGYRGITHMIFCYFLYLYADCFSIFRLIFCCIFMHLYRHNMLFSFCDHPILGSSSFLLIFFNGEGLMLYIFLNSALIFLYTFLFSTSYSQLYRGLLLLPSIFSIQFKSTLLAFG